MAKIKSLVPKMGSMSSPMKSLSGMKPSSARKRGGMSLTMPKITLTPTSPIKKTRKKGMGY